MERDPLSFSFRAKPARLKVHHDGDQTVFLSVEVEGEPSDPYLPMKVGGLGDALHQAYLYGDCYREGGTLHIQLTGGYLPGGVVDFQLAWDDITPLPVDAEIIDLGV